VRANIVKTIEELDRFAFCGHRTIIGKADHPWTDTDYVLARFGRSLTKSARRAGSAPRKS
jgi:hypothetical protein